MNRHLITVSMTALICLSGTAQAATNVAAGLPSSSYTDSQNWDGHTGETLFNGGSWNAGDSGIQWAQVDLLGTKLVTGISYATDQLPDGLSWQRVYISDTPIGHDWSNLTPAVYFEGYTTANTPIAFSFSGIAGRYVEIVAYNEGSWTALQSAVITAVPEPETYAMLLTGLGLMGYVARRRKSV